MIVGALANEGGLRRGDFGRIDIKPGFSLVELPADMSQQTMSALSNTRISGVLIDLKPDDGRPSRGPTSGPPRKHGSSSPHTGKKPRHKNR